jgi:hypothetical protein
MDVYFSDYFKVDPDLLDEYGAFNISLITDFPLFIDPFLLFNSDNPKYRELHDNIIKYLRFLRDRSLSQSLSSGLIYAWYAFPEVKQNWLGFTESGNRGSGLGRKFATALHENLNRIFTDFGSEKVTHGSHLEKLCLIRPGVGKDNISDFTTNLIKEYLLEYTQAFAKQHISAELRKKVHVLRVRFNYETQSWVGAVYDLPVFDHDYVLLTPKDILTRDDTWINKADLLDQFLEIPPAISDDHLRAQVNDYFSRALGDDITKKAVRAAAASTIHRYPELIDYFIKYKEEHGDEAADISSEKVEYSKKLYVDQFSAFIDYLAQSTRFYQTSGNTYDEAMQRVQYLKHVIEDKGGHRFFYVNGQPIEREKDLHILFKFTWYGSPSDASAEVDDGRGPVDFKISMGSKDKTLVEFKLAGNSQLKRNLQNQVPIYEKASDALRSIKVVMYFSESEYYKVIRILDELKLTGCPDIVLIDARKDNKPSASKA